MPMKVPKVPLEGASSSPIKVRLPGARNWLLLTVDLMSRPSVSVQPVASETMATAGIVSPMLASAEPSARFRLVCSRLARAAR